MILMEQWLAHAMAVSLFALLIGSVLLYLGADLVEAIDARSARQGQALRFGAAVLTGAGLGWPLQVLASDSSSSLAQLLGWMLGVAAAELIIKGMRPSRHRGLVVPVLAVITAAPLLVAAVALLFGRLQPALPIAAAGGAQALLLAVLHLPRGRSTGAVAGRMAAALLAVTVPAALLVMLLPLNWRPALPGLVTAQLALASAAIGALLLRNAMRRAGSLASSNRVESNAKLIDPLTQLPTRIGVELQLSEAVAECDRTQGRLAVLVFDLDGFSPVNSSFGHESGDTLLRQAAKRLSGCLGPHDTVGRIGGDDFVVLLKKAPSAEAIADFATHALNQLAKPYLVDEREISISCSVGIAQYPDDGGQTRLLACADAAKVAAKRLGGACYCFYAPGMDDDAREQLDMLRDLRRAVERNELELFYQPKIDAASGQVTAAEALLRWRHPVRGMVSPTVFIPVAERFGYMRDLGNWVIEAACQQAQSWRENGLRMRVAINLSAHQMRQRDIVERIKSALAQHRIHPSLLTCEITESVAMEDTQATQETFRSLGRLGVHLSIDDFGTGYSSLSYLRQLPASELKIDRAFITDVDTSADAQAVVNAVLKLAHALGLRVVAEGVETQRQQAILKEMGCDEFQGYLFARPMSAQALLLWAVDDTVNAPEFRASLFGDTTNEDFQMTAPQELK